MFKKLVFSLGLCALLVVLCISCATKPQVIEKSATVDASDPVGLYDALDIILTADAFNGTAIDNVESWFHNLPEGLTVAVVSPESVVAGSVKLCLQVQGETKETNRESIRITVPGSVLQGQEDIVCEPTPRAIWDFEKQIKATCQVTGPVGNGSVIVVELENDSFDASATLDINKCFINKPDGVSARLENIGEDLKSVSVKIVGSATGKFSTSPIKMVIPSIALVSKTELEVEENLFATWDYAEPRIIKATANPSGIFVNKAKDPIGDGDTLTINIVNDSLGPITLFEDLASWFTNAPKGLEAYTVEPVKEGSTSIVIRIVCDDNTTYTTDAIAMTIPASKLASANNLTIEPKSDVIWDFAQPGPVDYPEWVLTLGECMNQDDTHYAVGFSSLDHYYEAMVEAISRAKSYMASWMDTSIELELGNKNNDFLVDSRLVSKVEITNTVLEEVFQDNQGIWVLISMPLNK